MLWEKSILIFFNYLNFQIIKVNALYKVILCETGLVMAFEFSDGLVQPDRLAQIELIADVLQGTKNFVGAGIIAAVCNAGILQHMRILESSCP